MSSAKSPSGASTSPEAAVGSSFIDEWCQVTSDMSGDALQREATAHDMFDLAAPLLSAPVVGRLVCSRGSRLPIDISDSVQHQSGADVIVVGRGKELQGAYRIDTPRISSRHCVFQVDPITNVVRIKDTSTNGTYLNGVRLAANIFAEVQAGDKISLTKPTGASCSAARGEDDCVEFYFQRMKQVTTVDSLVEELTCSICSSVYIRPCSVLPCMHVFCAHCISQWLEKGSTTCAECRKEVTSVAPTHKIQQCVEKLLDSRPDLRPSEGELLEFKALDTIPPVGKMVRERKRMRTDNADGEDVHVDGDDNGYDRSEGSRGSGGAPFAAPQRFTSILMRARRVTLPSPCRECTTPSPFDGFQCPPVGPHLTCSACCTLFPERPTCGRPQRCFLCSGAFCNLYYCAPATKPTLEGISGAAALSTPSGGSEGAPVVQFYQCAAAGEGVGLLPLNEHEVLSLPTRIFGGNLVELGILTTHLAIHNIRVTDAWKTCLRKLSDGSLTPDLVSVLGPLTPRSAVCMHCAQDVVADLFLQYRRAIPASELSEEVSKRPNCWYGVNCRTQRHNSRHAQNFSHVCHAEKRKE